MTTLITSSYFLPPNYTILHLLLAAQFAETPGHFLITSAALEHCETSFVNQSEESQTRQRHP
jgi:hypothetical protein